MRFNQASVLLFLSSAAMSAVAVEAFVSIPVPSPSSKFPMPSSTTTMTTTRATTTSRVSLGPLHMLTLERQSDGDEEDDGDGEGEGEGVQDDDMTRSNMEVPSSSSSSSSSSNIVRLINQWKQQLSTKKNRSTPLTSAGRARLEKEIDLLQQFGYDSYNASQQLEKLWRQARGGKAYQALQIAEGMMIRDGGNMLLELIEQEDCLSSGWYEPLVSLANLLYMQGRSNDSKQLYELVLQNKPWHFNAINGLVKCNKELGITSNSNNNLYEIDVSTNSGPSRQLQQWSTEMVIVARSHLQESEYNLQNYFNDSHDTTTDSSIIIGVESVSSSSSSEVFVDAWQ